MKVDLNESPPPLLVKCRDGSILTLHHDYMDAIEKSGTAEAMAAGGITIAQGVLYRKIRMWEGVTDKGGAPIPIRVFEQDGKTEKQNNITKVLGLVIDWPDQLMLVLKLCAGNGLRFERVDRLLGDFMTPSQVQSALEEIEDFFKHRGCAQTTSSGASASTKP